MEREDYKLTIEDLTGLFSGMPLSLAQFVYDTHMAQTKLLTLSAMKSRTGIDPIEWRNPFFVKLNKVIKGNKDFYSFLATEYLKADLIDYSFYTILFASDCASAPDPQSINIDTYAPKGKIRLLGKELIRRILYYQVRSDNPENITLFEEKGLVINSIAGGFNWKDAFEGFRFWENISKKLDKYNYFKDLMTTKQDEEQDEIANFLNWYHIKVHKASMEINERMSLVRENEPPINKYESVSNNLKINQNGKSKLFS